MVEKTATTTVKFDIPFKVLTDAITGLSLEDKHRLFEMLWEQLEQADEDMLEQDPEVMADLEEAYKEIEEGKFISLEDFIKHMNELED
jgi:hypothetical protein